MIEEFDTEISVTEESVDDEFVMEACEAKSMPSSHESTSQSEVYEALPFFVFFAFLFYLFCLLSSLLSHLSFSFSLELVFSFDF